MLRAYSNFVLPIGIAAIFAASFGLRQGTLAEHAPRAHAAGPPMRIVSLAPSTTEVLFAIGAGDRVVGVTRFCKYPPDAQTKTSIGGFMDTNYEAIVALRPDLVVLLAIHGAAKDRLEALGVPTLEMDHRTLDGILGSIRTAGEILGADDAADPLITNIESRLEAVSNAVEGADRPRVLLSSGRTPGPIGVVYVAGKEQWYDDVIRLAGGENAYTGVIQFPDMSAESVLRLRPDVIVELSPDLTDQGVSAAEFVRDWDTLAQIPAVEAKRVHVLTEGYGTIPGPRFVDLVEDLARLLHPERS